MTRCTSSSFITGVKTVTATAAEVFAGSSRLAYRRKMLIKNEDGVLRVRIGNSAVTEFNGFPLEPGASIEIEFDPESSAIPIYALSEGAEIKISVIEY